MSVTNERYCQACGAVNATGDGVCFACGESLRKTSPLAPEAVEHFLKQRYRILRQVGKGGFSAVYQAQDTLYNDHPIAVKAISLRGLKAQEIIEATAAFNREVELLTKLKHPNLPRIYDHFSDTECWYMVMDFIEGETLEQRLESGKLFIESTHRLPVQDVLDIGIQLCDVLNYLHTRQPPIIFRDLKPANIMFNRNGHLALIDFGIARHFTQGKAKDTMPFGSPGYAAPEQYGRAQTTPRTDIYSLGALLHQLLTGDDPSLTPFRFAPLQLQDPNLVSLEQLQAQMVQMDPQERPPDVAAIKRQLSRIAEQYSQQRGLKPMLRQPVQSTMISWPPPSPARPPVATYAGGQVMVMAPQIGAGQGSASRGTYVGTTPKVKNRMAVTSLILSVIGIFFPLIPLALTIFYSIAARFSMNPFVLLFFAFLALIPTLLGIIFGHIALKRAKVVPGMQYSHSTALLGTIIGYFFLFFWFVIATAPSIITALFFLIRH